MREYIACLRLFFGIQSKIIVKRKLYFLLLHSLRSVNCWECLVIFPPVFFFFVSLPDVYTQFRKAVETQSLVRPAFPTPEQLKPLPPGLQEGAIPTAQDLQQTGECPYCAQYKWLDSHSIWSSLFQKSPIHSFYVLIKLTFV